jgi:hypothetical protein
MACRVSVAARRLVAAHLKDHFVDRCTEEAFLLLACECIQTKRDESFVAAWACDGVLKLLSSVLCKGIITQSPPSDAFVAAATALILKCKLWRNAFFRAQLGIDKLFRWVTLISCSECSDEVLVKRQSRDILLSCITSYPRHVESSPFFSRFIAGLVALKLPSWKPIADLLIVHCTVMVASCLSEDDIWRDLKDVTSPFAFAALEAMMRTSGVDAVPRTSHTCPITLSECVDPVVASDGFTYERSAILKVMRQSDIPHSPMTREVLDAFLISNDELIEKKPYVC